MSRRWLIAVSGVAHFAVAGGLFATGVWHVERLHADTLRVDLVQPPPAPPAPSGGPQSAVTDPINPKPKVQTIPKEPRQPELKPRPDDTPATPGPQAPGPIPGPGDPTATGTCTENCGPAAPAAPVCGDGSVDLSEQCDDGNTASGDGCSLTCRTEPRPEPRTSTVAPNVLRGLRTWGETQVRPDTVTQGQMIREGATSVRGVVKVCIATDGHVASATMAASTKFPTYDGTLLAAVRDWRYQPYLLGGTPVPACSTVTFVYTIR